MRKIGSPRHPVEKSSQHIADSQAHRRRTSGLTGSSGERGYPVAGMGWTSERICPMRPSLTCPSAMAIMTASAKPTRVPDMPDGYAPFIAQCMQSRGHS